MDNFAVFILSYGRPNNVKTISTLKKQGYTGDIYLVLSDDDETIPLYRKNYPNIEIRVFNKKEISKNIDTRYNSFVKNIVLYARHYANILAKELGLKYHLQLDDDYQQFVARYNNDLTYRFGSTIYIDMDNTIENVISFLDSTQVVSCICFAQGGDYIGGDKGKFGKKIFLSRKIMNSFFVRTSDPLDFQGIINEDTNLYTSYGKRGKLFGTLSHIVLNQGETQKNDGGLTDIYKDQGTYVKSFYTILDCPSSVTIDYMGDLHKRLHHKINWDCTVPKILSDKYK